MQPETSFLTSPPDSGRECLTLSTIGLADGVSPSGTWSLFAGANRAPLDGFAGDMTSVGAGVGSRMPYFGATAFAKLSRASFADDVDLLDPDTLRVGMTFLIGGTSTTGPKGTVAGGVATDSYRSAAQAVRMTL